MSLLNLVIKLGVDGASAMSGIKSVQSAVDGLASKVVGAFASGAVVSAIGYWVKSTSEAADRISDLAEQLGATPVQFMKMEKAAKLAGLETETFTSAIRAFGKARSEALDNNEKTIRQLKEFGITMRDLADSTKSNPDLLFKMGKAMESMKLTPEQRNDLNDLLGKSGSRMVEAMTSMGSVSRLTTNEDVARLAKANKSVENAFDSTKDFGMSVLGGLAPVDKDYYLKDSSEPRRNMRREAEIKEAKQVADEKYRLDSESQKKLNEQRKKAAELERDRLVTHEKNRFSRLSDEDKVKELTSMQDYARRSLSGAVDPIRRAQTMLLMEETDQEIYGLMNQKGKSKGGSINPATSASSYGNFIFGSSNNESNRILRQQVKHLATIELNTSVGVNKPIQSSLNSLDVQIGGIP